MNDFFETWGETIIAVLIILMFSIPILVFSAHKEAEQFNKFSKTKITWVDALFAEYRILPDK